MNYQDALDYIYSFVDYSRTHMQNLAPENFDLGRVRKVLHSLGNPHQKYKIVHIAGSKGKGSTAAMCTSILRAAGYKTGLNTSPHMEDFCERIRIDGQEIKPEEVASLVEEIRPVMDAMEFITTFEIITCLAFLYFAKQEVDFVCLEVGLGGRLDATNVVTPLVSVITSISLEHTTILGDTLEEIAAEKAGIIKENIPVVSSTQKEEVRKTIQHFAVEQKASLVFSSDRYSCQVRERSLEGQCFSIQEKVSNLELAEIELPLIGSHQVENALTVYTIIHELKQQGIRIPDEAILEGFRTVSWPGRMELIHREPFVIVDGAHNPDSAQRLRQALDDFLPDVQMVLIAGFSGDKDLHGILDPLLPRVREIVASQAVHPRAMPPQNIAAQLADMGRQASVADTIEEAVELAFQAVSGDDVVLVTGSLFMVGAAKSAIRALQA